MPAISPTAFNPNYLDELSLTTALAEGSHAAVLQAFFGLSAYQELSHLAHLATSTPKDRCAPNVYLLPGLLGSKLGLIHDNRTDLIWFEPAAVISGRLSALTFGTNPLIRPLGVMLPPYLKLALTLQAAGMNVKLYPYDWRCSIIDTGQRLATDIAQDPSDQIQIVAHSMGGLVARAAMNHPAFNKASRLIQLGTPNLGSFALLQTLRACYPTVRKLATLDRHHSAEELTQRIFSSFPSFYEMLPSHQHTQDINLFDKQCWPQDALTPSAEYLHAGQKIIPLLANADQRCHTIVGTSQKTVTGLYRSSDEFIFQISHQGDGTVPIDLAKWKNSQHWFVSENHGQLPRSTVVCQAVVDLLHTAQTQRLKAQFQPSNNSYSVHSEAELRPLANKKIHWDRLSLNERRDLLEPVISEAFIAACTR